MWIHAVLLLGALQVIVGDNDSKIVCYYDSRGFSREGKQVFCEFSRISIHRVDDVEGTFNTLKHFTI